MEVERWWGWRKGIGCSWGHDRFVTVDVTNGSRLSFQIGEWDTGKVWAALSWGHQGTDPLWSVGWCWEPAPAWLRWLAARLGT